MTDRKKPTAGFWITVALVTVLVGYPLRSVAVRGLYKDRKVVCILIKEHNVIAAAAPRFSSKGFELARSR